MDRQRMMINGGDLSYNHVSDQPLLMESSSSSSFYSTTRSSSSSKSSSKSPVRRSQSLSPPLPLSSTNVGGGGLGYIEHRVTKYDTLAGVAIKYGVEVADIKRMNGLVTDLQMFALKSLQIPLPGRHPPSPVLENGLDAHGQNSAEHTPPPSRRHSDLFDSLRSLKLKPSPQRRVSSAMNNLQGYYGLEPIDQKVFPEGCEMAVYRKGEAHYLEDSPFAKSSLTNPPLSIHRKSKSLANGLSEKGESDNDVSNSQDVGTESDKWILKLFKGIQPHGFLSSRTPEMLLKEDSSNNIGFSTAAKKGLALRPKAASRTASHVDSEVGSSPVADSVVADVANGVRKSSSTPSLLDSDNGTSSSSIWSTSKWSLTTDIQQALSNATTAAITRPIFDGFPKPMTGRKNKAALD